VFFSEEQAKPELIFYPGGVLSSDAVSARFTGQSHPTLVIRIASKPSAMTVIVNDEQTERFFETKEELLIAARQLAGEAYAWASASVPHKAPAPASGSKTVPYVAAAAVCIVALAVLLQFAPQERKTEAAAAAASSSSSGLVAAPFPAVDAATLAAFQAAALQAQAASGGASASASGSPVAAGPREAAKLTADEAKMIEGLKGIVIRPGKQMLTVFSDPLCPACREFEKQLAEMDKNIGVRIIPVAFQPGSAEKVAAILCAADPAKAWQQAMSVAPIDAAPCDGGKKSAVENNAAFSSIQATATPTLVAPNGTLAVGGADDVRQLNTFVTSFSK
jgi:protein-disulfide isomerase